MLMSRKLTVGVFVVDILNLPELKKHIRCCATKLISLLFGGNKHYKADMLTLFQSIVYQAGREKSQASLIDSNFYLLLNMLESIQTTWPAWLM